MTQHNIPDPSTQDIPQAMNLFKSVLFPVLIIIGFQLSNMIAIRIETLIPADKTVVMWSVLKWSVIGLIALVNAILITGMGILAHDGVHKVLFRNRVVNDLLSSVLSAHALLPFYANRQFHLRHHSFAHQPGIDPEEVIHNRPYLAALLVGPFFGLLAQYNILLANILDLLNIKKCFRAMADMMAICFAGFSYFYWLPLMGIELNYTVIPLLIVLPLVYNYRAMSDHYGLPAVIRKSEKEKSTKLENNHTLQEETSGWVVETTPLLEWLWSNINYHEVHHKYPYLSYNHLPEMFEKTRDKFPYAVVNGYTRSLINLRKQSYYKK